MVDVASPVSLPSVLQGRYRIGPVLGRGGASVVYRARRPREGAPLRLGGLNHHALVALLDAGVDLTDATAPQMFLIMEFVDGPDLRRRLRKGALTAFEVAYLAWDLLA